MDVSRGRAIAQTNRFAAAVRKLLSIKGEEHDVSYGVHLEEERPEYSFLKGETLWSQFNQVAAAGAGNVARVLISNPGGSGVLGVITSCFAYVEAAGVAVRVGYFLNIGVAPGGASLQPRDIRNARAASTTLRGLADGASAGPGFTGAWAEIVSLAANDVMDFIGSRARIGEIILPPNTAFGISTTPAAVHTLSVTISGYERPLESGELI